MEVKPATAQQKGSFSTKIYVSVLNELLIKAVIMQTVFVVAYLIIWFKFEVTLNTSIREKFNKVIEKSQSGVMSVQNINGGEWYTDAASRMDHLADFVYQYISFDSKPILSTLPHVRNIGVGDSLGFFVDGSSEEVIGNLDAGLMSDLLGLASPFQTGSSDDIISKYGPDLVSLAVTKVDASGSSTFTVIKIVDSGVDNLSDLFYYTDTCFKNGICDHNFTGSDLSFKFNRFIGASGFNFSPIKWFKDKRSLDVWYYSVLLPSNHTATFFIRFNQTQLMDILSTVPSKYAVFSSSRSSTAHLSQLIIGQQRKDSAYHHIIDPSQQSYHSFISSLFKSLDPSTGISPIISNNEKKEYSTTLTTLGGVRVFSSFLLDVDSFFFREEKFLSQLFTQVSVQITGLVLIVVLNIYFIHK